MEALEPRSLAELSRMGLEARVGISVMSPTFPDGPRWVTMIAYKEVTGREKRRVSLQPTSHPANLC